MKTRCYCVYCPRHPLFDKRHEIAFPVGWYVGKLIWDYESEKAGVDVDCLLPESPAFEELEIGNESYEYPITAYGDGSSQTGFDGRGYSITAYCANEEYVE